MQIVVVSGPNSDYSHVYHFLITQTTVSDMNVCSKSCWRTESRDGCNFCTDGSCSADALVELSNRFPWNMSECSMEDRTPSQQSSIVEYADEIFNCYVLASLTSIL